LLPHGYEGQATGTFERASNGFFAALADDNIPGDLSDDSGTTFLRIGGGQRWRNRWSS
jgi:hypothetical protein